MITDSIGDLLIRIKNGYLANKREVNAPYSKIVMAISELLLNEGFVTKVDKKDNQVSIVLRYENHAPILTDVKRISKPGLRVYSGSKKLPIVLNGLGIAIISTPKGLMTDRKARKEGLGGEVLAFVW